MLERNSFTNFVTYPCTASGETSGNIEPTTRSTSSGSSFSSAKRWKQASSTRKGISSSSPTWFGASSGPGGFCSTRRMPSSGCTSWR
jgi:hypothetical protein